MNNQECGLFADGDGLILVSPYHPGFLADFKAKVPSTDRRFERDRKVWIITPGYANEVAILIQKHFKVSVRLPKVITQSRTETRIIEVRYLGGCKQREDGSKTAMGYAYDGWNVVIPEAVLRMWFEGVFVQDTSTYYGLLGVKRNATEEDIKTGFRRMAKQWHPDVCKESGASEVFQKIQAAYSILSNQDKRARYDAGLQLQASMPSEKTNISEYRPPLRCGLIMADGTERVGRFVVDEIKAWTDIIDPQGRVLVTFWRPGADMFEEVWS